MQPGRGTSALLDEGSSDATIGSPRQTWTGGWPQTPREFEALMDHPQPRPLLDQLVYYAFRRLRDVGDAEDVVQEVLVRAYADRAKRKGVQRVVPYLYRMVANECTVRCRRNGNRPLSLESIGLERAADERNSLSVVQELHWIEGLLSQLPHHQAEVIRLRVLDELPLAEIAEIVGCSLSTAKSRLCYGLQKLRRIVPNPEEDER